MSVVDPGLQPERTLLAWRRTCLALAIGVTLAARYLLELNAAVAVVVGAGGLLAVAAAYVATAERYRRVRRRFDAPPFVLDSGGRSLAALASIALLVCVAAAVFVLGRA